MKLPVFGLLFLMILYHKDVEASATKCYQCEIDCDTLKEEDCVKTHGEGKYLCTIVKIEGEEKRSCVADIHETWADCEMFESTSDTGCSLCDTDLCNSAEKYSGIITLFALFYFLAKFVQA